MIEQRLMEIVKSLSMENFYLFCLVIFRESTICLQKRCDSPDFELARIAFDAVMRYSIKRVFGPLRDLPLRDCWAIDVLTLYSEDQLIKIEYKTFGMPRINPWNLFQLMNIVVGEFLYTMAAKVTTTEQAENI